jgi:hypothetical protein
MRAILAAFQQFNLFGGFRTPPFFWRNADELAAARPNSAEWIDTGFSPCGFSVCFEPAQ